MADIRPVALSDAPAIAAIYAHHVLTGTGTFEEVPPTPGEIHDRIARVIDRGWPWLVAECDGAVMGYAYAAQFRDRAAYRYACEDSIYVAASAAGAGIGSTLLGTLIAAARDRGFRQMIAVIGDADNLPSVRLHARFGFATVGLLSAVGHKFGRTLDVVQMQRAIA